MFAVIAATALTASTSQASLIILGNLPQMNDGGAATIDAGTDNVGNNFTNGHGALSFTMPAQNFPLSRVTLRLGRYNTSTGDSAQVGVFLDSGNDLPGTQVAMLSSPASATDDIADFEFTPSATFVLAASTKYWLVVDATAGEYDWRGNSPSATPTSQVGATYGKFVYLVAGNPIAPSPFFTAPSFEITTTVPEPLKQNLLATFLAAAICACRVALPRRQEKRIATSQQSAHFRAIYM
jgi:hypothetical protein